MTTNADRRSVVDGIRRENEDEFGERARAAVQKLLSAGLPPPWMYVYELTQNALDAGARRVCWRSEGDAVTFQHDGRLALDESHVRGLSSLGASTKGLATVGFMGVGFKSVFARFREACVSGADWRFRFDVHVRGGDLGSEVPEWFDTLRPHWDDEAPAPDAGYTTAFFLGRPADRQRPVADDLERLASTENRATLAVLARRGLTQVSVDDVVWDLATLLREALEAVGAGEATEDDLRRALAVVNLHGVPLASRVVRRTGAGARARGNLGGWVVALSDVEPALAEAVQALAEPLAIPDTTTGRQALDFLLDTWERKPAAVEVLRGHLAAAYRYVLDDKDAGELPVGAWEGARVQAQLYGHRGWHPSVRRSWSTTCIHRSFASFCRGTGPRSRPPIRAIPRRRFGASNRLSTSRCCRPRSRSRRENVWGSRLRRLTATLSQLEDRLPLHDVTLHNALSLRVGGRRHAIQAFVEEGDDQGPTLLLVGRPADFAVEAAEQLVEHFQLGQRGQEIPRLTGALSALDDERAFLRHLTLLADGLGFAPATVQSKMSDAPPMQDASTDEDTDVGPDPREKASEAVSDGEDKDAAAPTGRSALPGHDTHPGSAHARRDRVRTASGPFSGSNTRPGSERDYGEPAGPNGRSDHETARRSGTRPPTPGRRAADHVRMLVVSRAGHDTDAGDAASARGGARDDHRARQAVLHYEKHRGWQAEAMPDLQPGFDVRSVDDAGRERRIEVKGVQGRFEENASVALTAQQANDALRNDEERVEYWLYVVDSTETERPRVFPIRWARDRTYLRYGFYAYAWCDAAEHPAEATAEGLVALSPDAPEPLDPGDLPGNHDQAGNGRLT